MKLNELAAKNKIRELAEQVGLKIPQIEILLAQERFMARLGSIDQGRHFVWKGGSLILRLYRSLPTPRFTIDLDLLLRGFKVEDVTELLRKVVDVDLQDGFQFTNITHTPMKRETPYGGTRYKINWTFYNRQRSQSLDVDVCAGDVVSPRSILSRDIFLLDIDSNPVSFSVYPAEYIVAEKLETIFRFKTGNTRVKDFVDIYSLISCQIDKTFLADAINRCFQTRNTPINLELLGEILSDNVFLDDLEKRRLRSFPSLELPHMKEIAQKIHNLVLGLSIK